VLTFSSTDSVSDVQFYAVISIRFDYLDPVLRRLACNQRKTIVSPGCVLLASVHLKQYELIDLPEDRSIIQVRRMPSYQLGPVAEAGVQGTYWSTSGEVDTRPRMHDQGPLSFRNHQPLDQATTATSSGMGATSASSQQRHQISVLSCIEGQLNCTTPRKPHLCLLVNKAL